ncbi:hypothetical protein A11A3_08535 [Alcanivorax hongdengensis A-11-3]|uniref:DUF4166 domain-containing protein n=1 Tax=Alcanivorax hongdengensis A-11-3 TaxID=1177179 RepID=L0WBU4_9GAMM|nr:hypothetical protein [Alcanivorax hongdengensis]EKF74454.1 hypothetical protein A11A3_08535 [Alcanivorax hongdengensis A-11-3]
MSTGLLLKEAMSGWLKFSHESREHAFAFRIRAFTTRVWSLSAPRFFKGTVTLDGEHFPCEGELTIRLSGPHYWLTFRHPEHGLLRVEGQKQYGRGGLLQSLVTCPLTVSRDHQTLGRAQVAYRDSMLAFPFTALRLVREDKAYGDGQ